MNPNALIAAMFVSAGVSFVAATGRADHVVFAFINGVIGTALIAFGLHYLTKKDKP